MIKLFPLLLLVLHTPFLAYTEETTNEPVEKTNEPVETTNEPVEDKMEIEMNSARAKLAKANTELEKIDKELKALKERKGELNDLKRLLTENFERLQRTLGQVRETFRRMGAKNNVVKRKRFLDAFARNFVTDIEKAEVLFDQMDTNEDGELTMVEFKPMVKQLAKQVWKKKDKPKKKRLKKMNKEARVKLYRKLEVIQDQVAQGNREGKILKALPRAFKDLKKHDADCKMNPVCIPVWYTLAESLRALNRVEEADLLDQKIFDVVVNDSSKKTDELLLQGLHQVGLKLLNEKLYNDAYEIMKMAYKKDDLSLPGQVQVGRRLAETLICTGEIPEAMEKLKALYDKLDDTEYYGSFQQQLMLARKILQLHKWDGDDKAVNKLLKIVNKQINIKWTASWNPLSVKSKKSSVVVYEQDQIRGAEALQKMVKKQKKELLAEFKKLQKRPPTSLELSCFEDKGDVSEYNVQYCEATNSTTPVACEILGESRRWDVSDVIFTSYEAATHLRPHSAQTQYIRYYLPLRLKDEDGKKTTEECLKFVTKVGEEVLGVNDVFLIDDAHTKEVFCNCPGGCDLLVVDFADFPDDEKSEL